MNNNDELRMHYVRRMHGASLLNSNLYFATVGTILFICIILSANNSNAHFAMFYMLIVRLLIVGGMFLYTRYIKKNINNMDDIGLFYHSNMLYAVQYIPLLWSFICIILFDQIGKGGKKNILVVNITIFFIIFDLMTSLFQICATSSLRINPYVGIVMLNLVNTNRPATDEEINKVHEHIFISNEHVNIYNKNIILKCDDECTICLSNYNDNEQIRIIMCGHYYHKKCIDEWFKSEFNCPNCRYNIKENNFGEELEVHVDNNDQADNKIQSVQ